MSNSSTFIRQSPLWATSLSLSAVLIVLTAVVVGPHWWILAIFGCVSLLAFAESVLCVTLVYQGRIHRSALLTLSYGLVPLVGWWMFLAIPVQTPIGYDLRAMMNSRGMQMGLACHSFSDVNKHLPTDIVDAKQTPLLSWRVSISPYLDERPTYRKFDLKQPWDGPTNLPLVDESPRVLRLKYGDKVETPWQGFVGPGTAFDPIVGPLTLAKDFPDGLENTILIAESPALVPWSKPADIPFGPGIPLPNLTQQYHKRASWPQTGWVATPGFHIVMADGSVRFMAPGTPPAVLRQMLVRNDGGP